MNSCEGNTKISEVAKRYAEVVRHTLKAHVKMIVLFGSHARGDANDGSDYDFVVVLDRQDETLRDKVVDAGVTLMNETDRLCAALVYAPDQWERVKHSPLGWNVLKEGLVL